MADLVEFEHWKVDFDHNYLEVWARLTAVVDFGLE